MTEETRDPLADWHAQFAPAPAGAVEGEARPDLAEQVAVEHFAGDDGVFAAPVEPVDETVAEAAAVEAPKVRAGKRGDTEASA